MEPIPTPGEWLAGLLASTDMSHAALARRIGRSRAEVTRWTSGREQIPRRHLAEIADQLGPSSALDYALRLKDCEDAQDNLLRSSMHLAKRIGTRSSDIGGTLLAAVNVLENTNLTGINAAQERMRLLTAASFTVDQWSSFAEHNNADLFTPDSIGRHLRYPVNHFVGTLLLGDLETSGPTLPMTRVLGLTNLRELAKNAKLSDRTPLIRHHAIHMLARYGDEDDRATVQEIILRGLRSADRLSRKLGFSGLIMAQGADSEIADQYLYELVRDSELAAIDLAFDATHYGDLSLGADGTLRPLDSFAPMLIHNIIKHYKQPEVYGRQADIDAFRALSVLNLCQQSEVPGDVEEALISCMESGAISPSGGTFQRMLYRSLSNLPALSASSRLVSMARIGDALKVAGGAHYDLFIAYHSTEKPFVTKLYARLASKGLKCWVDFRSMKLGRPIQQSMQNGLESSNAFLVVLGNTVGRWQEMELQRAITHFVEDQKLVIPFVISGTAIPQAAPVFLHDFHGIFLDDYENLDAACTKIAAAIRSSTRFS